MLFYQLGMQTWYTHYIQMIDKLILTDGQNVAPQFYGEEKRLIGMIALRT
nr:gamma-glutamyl-gamma-aminobutyrate hydrolase family protein [Streptococcus intermedius]